ncbi:hypothetical protein FXO37_19436 [Capsicum annuum]|nr:hypothetical protein FXO37_19436 [Capsicum annuum]
MTMTLSSGLDDYPCASHPNEDERHVDLRCWMHLAADSMHSIAELLKMDKDIQQEYSLTAKLLSDFEVLYQMHLDAVNGAYCDYRNHTEKSQAHPKSLFIDVGPHIILSTFQLTRPGRAGEC